MDATAQQMVFESEKILVLALTENEFRGRITRKEGMSMLIAFSNLAHNRSTPEWVRNTLCFWVRNMCLEKLWLNLLSGRWASGDFHTPLEVPNA